MNTDHLKDLLSRATPGPWEFLATDDERHAVVAPQGWFTPRVLKAGEHWNAALASASNGDGE